MTENAAASTDPARAEEAVTERARAGIATICVAAMVAFLTLAFALGTLFVTGLVPLPGLQDRIAAAISDRLGRDWEVHAGGAELRRIDGRAQLQLEQVSFRHKSGAVIRAPQALVGYDPLALLTAQLRLTSVDLRGVNVRLGVDREGALLLSADSGSPPAALPMSVADPGQLSGFAAVMAAVSALNTGDGLLGSIETAGIRGARLTLVDPDGRVTAGLEDVDIRLSRAGEGVSRLTLSGRVGQRWKELAIDLTRAADGSRRAAMHIQRFEPAEIVALAAGAKAARLEGLTLSGDVVLTEAAGGERSIAADLAIDPGSVRFGDTPLETVSIDGARLRMVSDGSLSRYRAEAIEIRAGATRLNGTGAAREASGSWSIDLDLAGMLAGPETADSVALVDALKARLTLDGQGGSTRLDSLSVKGPAIDAEATGLVRKSENGLHQQFSISAVKSDARAVLSVWPAFSSPEVHTLLRQRLRAGLIERVDVRLDLDPAGHAALVKGQGMPASALEVKVRAAGVTFLPGDGLPELRDATVDGVITGRTAQIAVPRATAPTARDRGLSLSEGSFTLTDIWLPRTPARIAFRTQGPVDALLGLFAFPALREFAPQGIGPGSLKGQSDLRTTLALPLADDIAASEVVVQSSGTLSNLSSETLLGTEKFDAGQLAISYDSSGLQAKGEARIGGDRGQVEIRQNARGQGEATIVLALDNAARQKRGFGPDAGIGGVVTARVVKPLARGADNPPRIELDFGKASIDGTVPGLSKAAGRPGRASFVYVADPDGPDLEQFVFEAGSVSMRGRVELNRQNGLDSASFTQLKLSPGDNLRAEIRRDGNVTKATIRGAVADARPFVQDLQTAAGPGGRGKDSKGSDLDLDVEVPIVTGHNSEAITNFVLKASLRGGEIRSLNLDGRLGRADVTARHSRQGAGGLIVVQTGNGGALLRFADLYRRAHGGQLFVSTGLGDGRQSGELLYRDFVVRDEPALRRVIGGSRQANAGEGGGQAQSAFDGSDVAFTKLRAEFTRSAGRLDVSDMVLWGQQVGFTLQGTVDFARDRVDIGGTFVPGYAFNNAFAQVPVVGALLGGGSQYGGLFAVNFRISGAASAPTMSINPLSAIAPGILRRFVDPLGGAPAQRPIQPSGPGVPSSPQPERPMPRPDPAR